jgi:hypothetical protein
MKVRLLLHWYEWSERLGAPYQRYLGASFPEVPVVDLDHLDACIRDGNADPHHLCKMLGYQLSIPAYVLNRQDISVRIMQILLPGRLFPIS